MDAEAAAGGGSLGEGRGLDMCAPLQHVDVIPVAVAIGGDGKAAGLPHKLEHLRGLPAAT